MVAFNITTMTVTIKDKEYNIRFTMRAILMWETARSESEGRKVRFELQNFTDEIEFFYYLILACNPESALEFEDFFNYVDEHPEVISAFHECMNIEAVRRNAIIKGEGETDDSKKK